MHRLAVGIVGRGTALLGGFATIFGQLALLFRLDSLLLGGRFDALILDRIGRIRFRRDYYSSQT